MRIIDVEHSVLRLTELRAGGIGRRSIARHRIVV
jgi:hypothetical protein